MAESISIYLHNTWYCDPLGSTGPTSFPHARPLLVSYVPVMGRVSVYTTPQLERERAALLQYMETRPSSLVTPGLSIKVSPNLPINKSSLVSHALCSVTYHLRPVTPPTFASGANKLFRCTQSYWLSAHFHTYQTPQINAMGDQSGCEIRHTCVPFDVVRAPFLSARPHLTVSSCHHAFEQILNRFSRTNRGLARPEPLVWRCGPSLVSGSA
ncbi:hypothetical protein BKA64DRAFT_444118 [Cadophora sp. MPI-SDFR-AT-0126]|nr:hypothetical protein BKA64DRAFT_444118 [Leotiomycetes sp. MPI-SDFR-AT-0126]